MGTSYEVWCGRQLVALRNTSGTAWDAAFAFLHSEGCRDDEIVRLSKSSLTWRGTIYRAVVVGSEDSSPENVSGWVEAFA
jgi:hypothetical protein